MAVVRLALSLKEDSAFMQSEAALKEQYYRGLPVDGCDKAEEPPRLTIKSQGG